MYAGIAAAEALENIAAATADAHRWGVSYATVYGEQLVDQGEPDRSENDA
ncbi:hypothetical protein [Streptomyces sp. NPDC050538]